jgi:hypothetical protein
MADTKIVLLLFLGVVASIVCLANGGSASSLTEPFINVKLVATDPDEQRRSAVMPAWSVSGYIHDPNHPFGARLQPPLEPRMNPVGYSGLRGADPSPDVAPASPHPVIERAGNYMSLNEYGVPDYSRLVSGAMGEQGLEGKSQENIDRDMYERYMRNLEYTDPSEMLPADDMGGSTHGALLSDPDTFIFDRQIYAVQKRRGWSGGDFFRGDLKIAPHNLGWFQTSSKAHLDLVTGAIGTHVNNDFEEDEDGMAGDTTIINQRRMGPDVCYRRV